LERFLEWKNQLEFEKMSVTHYSESFNQSVLNLPPQELLQELTSRGVQTEKVNQQSVLEPILKLLIFHEFWAFKHGTPFTWNLVSKQTLVQFFSEVVIFMWNEEMVFFGPFFPAPRARPVTLVAAFDLETSTWRHVATKGKNLDPFMVFKRMPIFKLIQNSLYVAYSDADSKRFIVDVLNMDDETWSELKTTGQAPTARDYVDGVFYKGYLYISGCTSNSVEDNIVHKLNLENGVWSVVQTTGAPPTCPNGSSILHQHTLYVFAREGEAIYGLNLEIMDWQKHTIKKIHEFSARRHSHLIQVYEDQLLLLRNCDGFQLHSFNLDSLNGVSTLNTPTSAKEWKTIETIGKRPNKVKTEASMVVHKDMMYVLGGQATKNHLLALKLKAPEQEKPGTKLDEGNQPPLTKMRHDGFEDITFVFPQEDAVVKAHKCVLAAKNPLFKELLKSSGKEIKVDNVAFELFKEMIEFFYNERIDLEKISKEKSLDLEEFLKVAQQYGAFDLQAAIMNCLLKTINPESAVKLLILIAPASTNSNEASELKEKYKKEIFNYIFENLKAVTTTSAFLKLCQEQPLVLREIFEAMDQAIELRPAKKLRKDNSVQIGSNSPIWGLSERREHALDEPGFSNFWFSWSDGQS
jgi:hypothetical protein